MKNVKNPPAAVDLTVAIHRGPLVSWPVVAYSLQPTAYRPTNGQPVLTEQRVVEVSAPDAQGVYHLDWTMTFKALDRDVLLDRTPILGEPEGKGYGGYAGLSVRFARELTNIQVVASSGPVAFTNGSYRGKAIAADYTGTLENQEIGIAMVDHPGNLNSPAP